MILFKLIYSASIVDEFILKYLTRHDDGLTCPLTAQGVGQSLVMSVHISFLIMSSKKLMVKACSISVFQLICLATMFLAAPCVFAEDAAARKQKLADSGTDAEIIPESGIELDTESKNESEARFQLTEEVVEREMDAEEDPMARQQAVENVGAVR